MKNLEIYCVTNKILPFLDNYKYILAGVGKNKFPKNYLRCDTENNIYHKEEFYSELAFHYWYWKNKLNISNNNWIGFCQKRRFWIKKDSVAKNIDKFNFQNHFLIEPDPTWKNYESILCNPIKVNNVKKIKLIRRGIKSIIKKPSILFSNKKQNLLLHFDMHHGFGNLKKAINILDLKDRNDFLEYVNLSSSFNPNIMFISKSDIIDRWFNDLFAWLFECEKVFGFDDLKGYDTTRLYAYLAERYLSFWFNKYAKVLEWPWTVVEN